jgi:transketolase N-terminal domain/subunit
MRNLNNPDELAEVLVEADEPIHTMIGDSELKRIFREGSYWELMMYAVKAHRKNLYAVVAALDGGITAADVPNHYSVTDIIALFRGIAANKEYREVFSLFGFAVKKKGAASSGTATANTGA